jgi:hypothetical protein
MRIDCQRDDDATVQRKLYTGDVMPPSLEFTTRPDCLPMIRESATPETTVRTASCQKIRLPDRPLHQNILDQDNLKTNYSPPLFCSVRCFNLSVMK